MSIEYNDFPIQKALVMKRSLEIFSPLNPAQIKNFSYSINSFYNRGKDKIYVINFQTKDKYFPKRTRIYGKGVLYYNITTKLVEKIIMENHQDQYAMFPRWKVNGLLPSATHHKIEVEYIFKDSQFFTKSVKLNVMWLDPQTDESFYFIKLNSRRNPIENNLKEFEHYEFDNFITLNKQKKEYVKYFLPFAWDWFCYTAPFDPTAWAKVEWKGINKQKLHTDLSICGRSLLQQAETNGLDTQFLHGKANQVTNRILNSYRQAKKIHQVIYEN